MKIINMLPILSYGDAVGNDALAIHHCLLKAGYDSIIAASAVNEKITEKVFSPEELSGINDEDVIIYHLSTGHPLNETFHRLPGKKIIRYHNITPSEYFYGYDQKLVGNAAMGYRDLFALRNTPDHILAVSNFNLTGMREMDYKADADIMPILIPFSDYESKPDEDVIKEMSDGRTNILFVGRIVPNKRQEQLIRAFYHYRKVYDESARLILAGNYGGMEPYYDSLVRYSDSLGLKDSVIYTGHVSFTGILAYYRTASALLCMSDHEGFCVPLVEAMYFDVPIIAKDSSAIAETMDGAGILLKDDDPAMAAAVLDKVIKNADLRNEIVESQKERLKDFSNEKIEKQLLELIKKFKGGKNEQD